MQGLLSTRRAVLRSLAGGVAVALSSCAAPIPSLPFRPAPLPTHVTVLVADAYVRVTGDAAHRELQVVSVDDAIPKWAAAAAATLQGRATIAVRAGDLLHATFWQEITAGGVTTEQPLYLASHAMLWRLRAGGLVADLHGRMAQDKGLAGGRLHPDAVAAFQWQGQQAGLPVALWPVLAATDARLPAPPDGWTWEDAARLPAGAGWPVQLMPNAPPLEAWLWPHQADLATADGSKLLIDGLAGIAALAAYAKAFGPAGASSLSPLPGGGAAVGSTPQAYQDWTAQAVATRDQQVQRRQVGAWFPADEWPSSTTGPHRWSDAVGLLRRIEPPGAAQAGLPMVAYGLGVPNAAAQPDHMYQVARALQDTAPSFLAYSPFTADQTANGLQRHWAQLNLDRATALARILSRRLRPVWGVPRPTFALGNWPLGDPATITDAMQFNGSGPGGRLSNQAETSAMLDALTKSISLVTALGLLAPRAVAANAAHLLSVIWTLMAQQA